MNAFEKHGLGHLSPSRINTWISNPSMCLLNIAGFRDSAGAAAWRGTATDRALTKATDDRSASVDDLKQFALEVFDNEWRESLSAIPEEKINKERRAVSRYVETGAPWIRMLPEPDSSQGKVVVHYDEIGVPVVGYYDLIIGDDVRDMKTSASAPNKLSESHARQLSVYWRGTGKKPWIDYISPKEVKSYAVENVEYFDRQFILAAKSLERVLSISDDILECCQFVYPDLDHWMWSETMKLTARDVWNMEGLTQ